MEVSLHGRECSLFSCVRLFVTPWTIAHQAPLTMEFSRQEHWSGLPFPLPGNLLCLLHWQTGCYLGATWKAITWAMDWCHWSLVIDSPPAHLLFPEFRGLWEKVPLLIIMRLFLWQPVPAFRCGPKVTSLTQQYTLLRKVWTQGFQELFSRNWPKIKYILLTNAYFSYITVSYYMVQII